MNKLMKFFAPLVLISLTPLTAMAGDLPGKHPAYLHALSDLRTARWFLEHQPGDAKVYGDEDVAITEIDAAINEIKRASIDDGKDLRDHPSVDIHEHGSRLLRSIETLKKARSDVDAEEDNPEVRHLRHNSLEHIDNAIRAAVRAHSEWLKDVKK